MRVSAGSASARGRRHLRGAGVSVLTEMLALLHLGVNLLIRDYIDNIMTGVDS